MSDESIITDFLAANDVAVYGHIIREGVDAQKYYVFVEVKRDGRNHQEPSNMRLASIKTSLLELGYVIDFILTDGAQRDIEVSVRASLLHSFGALVRNSFLSTTETGVVVWVEPKLGLTEDQARDIKQTINRALSLFDISLREVRLTRDDKLPSRTACLTVLRKISPADTALLSHELTARGLTVPSPAWLTRLLDNLRKNGQIIRLKSGHYALTLAGIKGLGTAKNANSPDLSRLLDLAKRGN